MAQKEHPPSLQDLEKRLRMARESHRPADQAQPISGGLGRALSLAVEMAAALAVGAGIGWLLDSWLNTRPWLLVAFIFLGIAAGMRNAFRAARRYRAGAEEEERAERDKAPREDETE